MASTPALSTIVRLAAVGLLLVSLLAAGVHHGSQPSAPELGYPPGTEEVIQDYDRHVGQRVVLEGTVIDDERTTIRAEDRYGDSIDLRIRDVTVDVAAGDRLSVEGILEPDRELAAIDVVHKPSSAHRRTLVLSLLAGLWVLGRALRHWRIDVRDLVVRPRSSPLGLWSLLPSEDDGGEDA